MTDLYDLAVIGGGPAGCAAAITARLAGAKVLLLDRAKFPRQKVCGEFVSSEALGLLRSLLGDEYGTPLFEFAFAIKSARIFMDGHTVTTEIAPAAKGIPRFDMDHALWRAAESIGVEAHQQTAVQQIEGSGPFRLQAQTGQSYSARAIVNASGRWSNLRTKTEDSSAQPKWIGVKAHFAEPNPAHSVDLYFFSGGYCGVQPVSTSRINVCAMVRVDIASTLPEIFKCERNLLERSAAWKQLGETVSTSPLIFREPAPLAGNILLAGDAAGFIDPFVGDGISMALHSGQMAASSLKSFLDGGCTLEEAAQNYVAQYQRKLLPAFQNAARARKMISAPQIVRRAALSMMRFSGVAEFLVHRTRARIV